MKLNERAWAGQIIAWIKEEILLGKTIFQDATNDAGIKVASGRTKFPDILLFTNKVSGIVFNGWELKYPDVKADDKDMILNALEKAERLKSNSFVTWNGRHSIIWLIQDGDYKIDSLTRVKEYKDEAITNRNDLADNTSYQKHEKTLRNRLKIILKDLQDLQIQGKIKEAINISDEFIRAIGEVAKGIIPQIKLQINELRGNNAEFRKKFNEWKIIESATLKILSSSSRRVENIESEDVLAKFTYYKIIGKVIFYLTLAENLAGRLPRFEIEANKDTKKQLNSFFQKAQSIDYQAVFEHDFSDLIDFNQSIDTLIFKLSEVFDAFNFTILPSNTIGTILENLVPKEEKQKFGQYFTPENLALFVAFPAIKTKNDLVFDPTSGTGTFLNVFYQTLKYLGKNSHQSLLSQIWGNDISHFPAVLSVINLYKQQVEDVANFPRVTRKDFFSLEPQQEILIPDNKDINKINKIQLPDFDAIISNFPFVQQEDIPNETLNTRFRDEFKQEQKAFLEDVNFKINERSDYYVYCCYNSLKFLKPDGYISIITSNAWLGKNYGLQFKRFILDNFSVELVVKSDAEHWFKSSQVSTIFIVLKRGKSENKAKFITINFKLDDYLDSKSVTSNLEKIEDFYSQIEFCDLPNNTNWVKDKSYPNVYLNKDKNVKVSLVRQETLEKSLKIGDNWATYFIADNSLSMFEDKLINPSGKYFTNGRGTRTGQDDMHIISEKEQEKLRIEEEFLLPILQSSRSISSIYHPIADSFLFVCHKDENTLKNHYPMAYQWIKQWEKEKNKTGVSLPKLFEKRKPFWYSLNAEEKANIFISINPDKKLFFSYTDNPIYLNQRLVAIRAKQIEVKIVTALLNSIVSLLVVELNGTSRNLGALDLNADFFKTKMKIFDPALLSPKQKQEIINKFEPLSKRTIENYNIEFTRTDRIAFDKTILSIFGYNIDILNDLYNVLVQSINNRVDMKNR
jgi:hypothetical protein